MSQKSIKWNYFGFSGQDSFLEEVTFDHNLIHEKETVILYFCTSMEFEFCSKQNGKLLEYFKVENGKSVHR